MVKLLLGDDVPQNVTDWETLVDVFAKGWDLSIVPVVVLGVVQLVEEIETVVSREAIEAVVGGWVVHITTDGVFVDDVIDVNMMSPDFAEDGVEVDLTTDHSFVDFWGDDVLLKEDLDEEVLPLVDDDIIEVLLLDWDHGVNNFGEDLLHWDDAFGNLDVNNLGLFDDDLAFTSDWLNNNLLVSGKNLNISLDFSDIPNNGLVGEQGFVNLV